jgi:hypothetical protein
MPNSGSKLRLRFEKIQDTTRSTNNDVFTTLPFLDLPIFAFTTKKNTNLEPDVFCCQIRSLNCNLGCKLSSRTDNKCTNMFRSIAVYSFLAAAVNNVMQPEVLVNEKEGQLVPGWDSIF